MNARTAENLERLADLVADRVAVRLAGLLADGQGSSTSTSPKPAKLVDAATLARRINVSRDWIYRNRELLGAVRLGGPKGRLRFDPDRAAALLAEPPDSNDLPERAAPRPRRATDPSLLPIGPTPRRTP